MKTFIPCYLQGLERINKVSTLDTVITPSFYRLAHLAWHITFYICIFASLQVLLLLQSVYKRANV